MPKCHGANFISLQDRSLFQRGVSSESLCFETAVWHRKSSKECAAPRPGKHPFFRNCAMPKQAASRGMTSHSQATPSFLAEHYVYEINMLRFTYRLLRRPQETGVANALIESFVIHSRALMDFFGKGETKDDVKATHFTIGNVFSALATSTVSPDIRSRMNKQIAHLTYSREGARKISRADRLILLRAIEIDHAAFKQSVAPPFVECFDEEVPLPLEMALSLAPYALAAHPFAASPIGRAPHTADIASLRLVGCPNVTGPEIVLL
jgi:hypothetical protein